MTRTWIHVDMDAFYAAVEIRDDPKLAELPIAVGDRNMIMTTNYLARSFGIRSGVPAFIGKKLCPELIVLAPNYTKYRAANEEFIEVLKQYDPCLETIGLDEANLDITDYLQKNELDDEMGRIFVANKIRADIKDKTKMTASCGIACNKMLAKICSDMNKPDGQTYLQNNEKSILELMVKLPVRKLPGVGKVNEQILVGMGIVHCSDSIDRAMDISINFTDNAFDFLIRSSLGVSKNVHEDAGVKKSLNCSETFQPITELEAFQEKLAKLCKELDERAQHQKLKGRTLTLEFKSDKFKNKQKSYTCQHYMDCYDEYYKLSLQLLE